MIVQTVSQIPHAKEKALYGVDPLSRVGNTPLLGLRRIMRDFPGVQLCAKAEWYNPGGSVKDRAASRMLRGGEESGILTRDKIILDSTSGNTGIAYAMLGAVKGYRVKLVMPRNISEERKRIIGAYGAEIVYTSDQEGSDGAILEAKRIYQSDPGRYFMPDQYNNPLNVQAHYETTGREIWEQTQGKVTHFLACIGTGGTVMGTSKRLKEFGGSVKTYAVEPKDAWHGLEGMKHMASSIKPGIFDEKQLDGVIPVDTEAAYAMVRRLAREEGLLVGQSSGAVTVAALQLAAQLKEGIIAVIFPDGGDKYLTTRVWESEAGQ